MLEIEAKFKVNDISETLLRVRDLAKFKSVVYIRDVIFGSPESDKKIRLRIKDFFSSRKIEATIKYKTDFKGRVKKEVEDNIYVGNNLEEAVIKISSQGNFKEENSYEKIRSIYIAPKAEIVLDIYPYGVWLEIEGDEENIWDMAKKLGYKKEDAITLNADELYLEWNKNYKPKEFWDVRFGFGGDK